MEETHSLLPATEIRGKLCCDSRLSKRAALLLRRECDQLGASILELALKTRAAQGGPLQESDLWQAVAGDHADSWLADVLCDRLGSSAIPNSTVQPLLSSHQDGASSASAVPPLQSVTLHEAFLTARDPDVAERARYGLHPSFLAEGS